MCSRPPLELEILETKAKIFDLQIEVNRVKAELENALKELNTLLNYKSKGVPNAERTEQG